MFAEAVLRTSSELNRSDANTLKSKPRPRLGAAPESLAARGGQGLEAVEAHAREVAAQAAHGDAAAFAVVAVERDAGQALQRFGEVGVGEVGDVLGVDGVHHHVGVFLHVDGVAQRQPVTGYLDLGDVLGASVRRWLPRPSGAGAASVLIGRGCAADCA